MAAGMSRARFLWSLVLFLFCYSMFLCILFLSWDLEKRVTPLLSALLSALPKEVLCSWLVHTVEMQIHGVIMQLLSFHWLRYQNVSFLSYGKAHESS